MNNGVCKKCNGTGIVECEGCKRYRQQLSFGIEKNERALISKVTNCSGCHGTGRMICPECKGKKIAD